MQTDPQITFKNMQSSPAMEALIRQRIEALEQMHPRITSCRVVVEIPHRGAESAKLPLAVAVEVELPGRPLVVGKDRQERHEMKNDHMAPLNRAFEAVERQLKRINDIQGREIKTGDAQPQSGMIVRLFPDQSYGFVEVDNVPELYFTRNAVIGGDFDELEVGMLVHVTRATDEGPMGPQASSIKLLDRAKTPS